MTLPLFLVLLLGIVDSGRLMATWLGMMGGVREAVRVASLPVTPDINGDGTHDLADVRQVVANLVLPVSSPGFNSSIHVKLVCRNTSETVADCANRTSGWSVEVVTAYPFAPLPLFSAPLGVVSSFGLSPFTETECTTSYGFAGQTFVLGGDAGCLILAANARGYVE